MTSPFAIGAARSSSAAAGTAHAHSSFRRSPAALLTLLAALVLAGLTVAPMADAADRDFAPRFVANDTGDIDIFGNTLMTCPTAANGCTAAQQSGVTTTADAMNQNNAYDMQFIDVDGDPTTFNSSRSTVSLPSGSTVLFAGLYWGGRAGGIAQASFDARGRVKFRAPGATGYSTLTASTLDDGGTAGSTSSIYQGFVDVTAQVRTAGSGVYTVADVQAATGGDKLAGWSLVIAYRDTTQPARNLSVFDGIKSIGGGATGEINVTGFTTPPAGMVNTRVGFVTYEGDGGIVGDGATLNGQTLSDAQHPATNFFNSRSSRDGVRRTATEPNYPNQLGIEQSILLANGILPNNATSARIGLSSSGDVYAPGVVTLATQLYAPKIDQTKTVSDLNGGVVEQGDTLRYTISGTNSGQDGATNFVVRDPVPDNTNYVAGSLKVSPTTGGTSASTAVSDAAGDDRGEYNGTNRTLTARLGTGSSATAGGTVPVNGTYAVTFDVVVGTPVADQTQITNTATASFNSASLNTPLTAMSSATATVRSPDLTVTKTGVGTIQRGQPYDYTLAVRNVGGAPTRGTVTITDTVPTGLSVVSAQGTGWNCVVGGATVTCTRSDALAPGAAYPTITLRTNVAADAPQSIANTATVGGGGDASPGNNSSTSTSTLPAIRLAGLSIQKSASVADAAPGSTVSYTLVAANSGPGTADDVVIDDALPAGVTFASADAPCTFAAGRVTCALGAIPAGESRTVGIRVTVDPIAGTFDGNATHQLDVTKIESNLAIQRQSGGTATATCPAGYLATDGSVRIDAIDQGSGTFADLKVIASGATADGTGWTGTVRNDTTGQAQLKVNVVCLKSTTTEAGGHAHDLLVSAPVTATRAVTPGSSDVVLECGPGRVAIAPSYASTTGPFGTVSGSQREGNGWRFTVRATSAAELNFSIRCLSTMTATANGHAHDLGLTQLTDSVVVPAGQTVEKQVTCADDAKGIVASTDIDPGLISLGNDPQPKTRVFKFTNPTSGPLTARLGLLCLSGRTSGELAVRKIDNTATVRTSTPDSSTADDSSTASFNANTAAPVAAAPAPSANPAPLAAVASTSRSVTAPQASVLSSSLKVRGTSSRATLAVPVRCATACTATAKLLATKAVKGTKIKKGSLLAIATLKLKGGKKGTVVMVAKGRNAKALRRGSVKSARLIVRTSKDVAAIRTVRVAR